MKCTHVDEDLHLYIPDADISKDEVTHKTVRPLITSVVQHYRRPSDAKTNEQKAKRTFIPSYFSPNVIQNEFTFCSSWKFENSSPSSSANNEKELLLPIQDVDYEKEHFKILKNNNNTKSPGFSISTNQNVEFIISQAMIWSEDDEETQQKQQPRNTNKNNNKSSSSFKLPSNPLPPVPLLLSATIVSNNLASTSVFKASRRHPEKKRTNPPQQHKISLGIFNFSSSSPETFSAKLPNFCLPIDREATVYFDLTPLTSSNENNDVNMNSSSPIKLRLHGKYQIRTDWLKNARMLYTAPSLLPIHFKKRKNFEDGLFPPHKTYNHEGTGNTNENGEDSALVALSRQPQLDVLPPPSSFTDPKESSFSLLKQHQLRCLPAGFIHNGIEGDKEAIVIQEKFMTQTGKNLVKLFNNYMNGEKDGDNKYLCVGRDEDGNNKVNFRADEIEEDLDYFLNLQSTEKKKKKKRKNNKNGKNNNNTDSSDLIHDVVTTQSTFSVQPSDWSPLLIQHHPKFKQFLVRYTPASRSRPVNIRRFPHRNSDIVGELKFGQVCEATGVVFDEADKDWYVEWRYIGGYSRLRGTFGPFLIALWNPAKKMETTVFDPPRFFAPASADERISVRVRSAPDIIKGKRTQIHLQHNEIRAAVAMHRDLRNGSVFVEWADGSGYSRKSGRILKSMENLMMMNGEEFNNKSKNKNNNKKKDEEDDDDDENEEEDEDEEDIDEEEQEENDAEAERMMNRIARDLRRQRRVGLARSRRRQRDPDFTPFGGSSSNRRNLQIEDGGEDQYQKTGEEDEFDMDNSDDDDEEDPDETRMFRNVSGTGNAIDGHTGDSSSFPPPIITPARLRRHHHRHGGADSSDTSSSDEDEDDNDDDYGSSSSSSDDDGDENNNNKKNKNNNDDDDDDGVLDDENYEERVFLVELPQIASMLMKD